MMEEESKKKLINEKIVGRKVTFRRVLQYFVIAIICGLLFGFAAAAAFAGFGKLRMKAEETLPAETEAQFSESTPGEIPDGSVVSEESSTAEVPSESETEAVNILPEKQSMEHTMEEEVSSEASEPQEEETAETDESESEPEEMETVPSEEDGGNREEDPETGLHDKAGALIMLQKEAVEKTLPYVVTVNAISTGTTWFESSAETTLAYAGIILDVTDQEILVLTTGGPADSETLQVVFADGRTEEAFVKQFSVRDDLAVLSVPLPEIPEDMEKTEETDHAVSGITPADSFAAGVGDPVIAIGAPLGVVNSCTFGSIGYVGESEPSLDAVQRILYADLRTNPDKGSFIINPDGELLGIASRENNKNGFDAGLSRIITIGSIKDTLDCLEAGEKQVYVGLEGFGVSGEMISNDIPQGMYITNVYADSPAYNAGIKRGDILTEMNGEEVTDAFDYANYVQGLHPEETVSVVVKRGSPDGEYRDISFMLSAGER